MKQLRFILGFLVFVLMLGGGQNLVLAANTPATAVPAVAATPAPAPIELTPLPLAPLATQLGQKIQTLVNPDAQPAADDEDTVTITDSFATGVLNTLAKAVESLKADGNMLASEVAAWPDFVTWLNVQGSDPHRQVLWNTIGHDLLVIVGIPLLGGAAVSFLLLPLRFRLRRGKPSTLPGRVGLLFGLFVLRSVPVIAFLGLALLLLNQNETHSLPRFVVLNVIYALALAYAIRQVLRGVLAPTVDYLRLISFTQAQAVYAFRWLSTYTYVIVYGYFLIDVASALHVPANAVSLFQNVFGLILSVMTIVVIFQTRTEVATILLGQKPLDTHSFRDALRGWLARHWHHLVALYLIIGLAVIWLSVSNGIALMLRGTLLTFTALALARAAFVLLGLWAVPKANAPALVHRQVLSFLLRLLIWIFLITSVAAIWGFSFGGLVSSPTGQRVTNAFVSIALTLFVLTAIYEALHASIERYLNKKDTDGKHPVASARARTLLPMVRNTVFILFSCIAILTCMSAIGINIQPLLAGAGVLGVAIGFGSQTLVKDFLTGLFIVVENTIAVGDVVKIGDFSGSVEAMSIRTIRLRDAEGTLHILPFSEVSKISNMSKGFAFALVDIGVAYDSDLEHVMNVLREIGADIQEDAVFKRVILEPIEVFGVEKLGDTSVTIRARMRTRPGKQWDVRRLLLLRIKQRFEVEKIEIPYPTSVYISKAT